MGIPSDSIIVVECVSSVRLSGLLKLDVVAGRSLVAVYDDDGYDGGNDEAWLDGGWVK